ncbi:MAG: chloride channel protein, partial [Bacteroidales bacterium]|nr:chloride channel protein [Bacteroidales bacterium]
MDFKNFIKNFLKWKEDNIKQRKFIILLSFIVGLLGGLAAVILKNSVHFIHVWLTEHVAVDHLNILYFAFPLTGITLTVLYLRFFVKDNISHGITRILFAISKKNGILKTHNTHSSLIASALTVG